MHCLHTFVITVCTTLTFDNTQFHDYHPSLTNAMWGSPLLHSPFTRLRAHSPVSFSLLVCFRFYQLSVCLVSLGSKPLLWKRYQETCAGGCLPDKHLLKPTHSHHLTAATSLKPPLRATAHGIVDHLSHHLQDDTHACKQLFCVIGNCHSLPPQLL